MNSLLDWMWSLLLWLFASSLRWAKPFGGSSVLFCDLCLCLIYSLRRVYVINKEVCVRTVCAHEELLRGGFRALYRLLLLSTYGKVLFKLLCVCVCARRARAADLCRDQFSRCGVAALSGGCSSLGGSCGKSCGGCWLKTDTRTSQCRFLSHSSTSSYSVLPVSPQRAFSCTTHYSCAKSTSVLVFFLSFRLSFYTCVWTNILQRPLMIV